VGKTPVLKFVVLHARNLLASIEKSQKHISTTVPSRC
jgi:hypothetical protein